MSKDGSEPVVMELLSSLEGYCPASSGDQGLKNPASAYEPQD